MNLRIRRRRFGQIAVGSAAVTALANFTGKTVAQDLSTIYGVSLGSNKILTDLIKLINTTPTINLIATDLLTGKELLRTIISAVTVTNRTTSTNNVSKAVYTKPTERITGFTTLSNGKFMISTVASTQKGDVTRVVTVDANSLLSGSLLDLSSLLTTALKVSGFKTNNSTIESLLALKDDQLLSVVSLNAGNPPFELARLDRGKLSFDADLPKILPTERLSNLVQSPINGKIYATSIGRGYSTKLVQLDLENKAFMTGRGKIIEIATLILEKEPLENDLLSLAFSPSGQLIALAKSKSGKNNYLYNVDLKSGEMNSLRESTVSKIAFARR